MIYYLIHTTNDPDCINWTELRTAQFNTDDQFPGVFLSIITKDNINKENIFPGKYIIILSTLLASSKSIPYQLLTGLFVSQLVLFFQCGPLVLLYKSTKARLSCVFTCACRISETKKNEMTRNSFAYLVFRYFTTNN